MSPLSLNYILLHISYRLYLYTAYNTRAWTEQAPAAMQIQDDNIKMGLLLSSQVTCSMVSIHHRLWTTGSRVEWRARLLNTPPLHDACPRISVHPLLWMENVQNARLRHVYTLHNVRYRLPNVRIRVGGLSYVRFSKRGDEETARAR